MKSRRIRPRVSFGPGFFLSLAVSALAPGTAVQAETVRDPLWITDGEVRAVAYSDNAIFIGGAFSKVGPALGGFATFDAASGNTMTPYVGVAGNVLAIAPDGAGGFFIGGSFTGIKGQSRNNLAHVDASGNAVAWNPDVNGAVKALVLQGTTLYVGGSFTEVGGQARTYLAAVDAATGEVLPWAPDPNGPVRCLVSNGTRLFVGGYFHQLAGATRHTAASFTLATGALDLWAPGTESGYSSVEAIAPFGSVVYLGGTFFSMGFQTRWHLAAVDATTGAMRAWNPNANGPVYALTITAINSIPTPTPTFWIGGDFTQIGTQLRSNLAAVDENGTVISFNPNPNGMVKAMKIATNGAGFVTSFFVGGDFTTVGGLSRPYVASLTSSGGVNTWGPAPTGSVNALASGSGTVIVGGNFYSANMTTRANLAALDATTGSVTPFAPGVDGPVNALLLHNRSLFVGGSFSLIATTARSCAAEIDIDTYFPSAWNPDLHCDGTCSEPLAVHAIARGKNATTVILGGSFTSAGSDPRRNIVATNGTTGAATTFNANVNLPVHALAIRPNLLGDNQIIVAGGTFNRVNEGLFTAPVGGTVRYGLAALNAFSGEATSWNPSPNTTTSVNALEYTTTGPPDPGTLWVGGQFPAMGGQFRNNVAALDAGTAAATAWNPNADGTVMTMLHTSLGVTLGGEFATVGGQPRNHLACVDAGAGGTSSWNPDAAGSVLALAANGGTVYAGGAFGDISLYAHPFFAGIGDGVVTAVESGPSPPAVSHPISAAPNPTGGRISVRFKLSRPEEARVAVYDIAGRLVRTLHRGFMEPGERTLEWNGNDASERAAASGVYFVRVESPSETMNVKVLRIR